MSDHGGCLLELLQSIPDVFIGGDDDIDYLGLGLALLGIAALGGAVCGLWYWIARPDIANSPLLYGIFIIGIVGAVGIWLTISGWLKSRGE